MVVQQVVTDMTQQMRMIYYPGHPPLSIGIVQFWNGLLSLCTQTLK